MLYWFTLRALTWLQMSGRWKGKTKRPDSSLGTAPTQETSHWNANPLIAALLPLPLSFFCAKLYTVFRDNFSNETMCSPFVVICELCIIPSMHTSSRHEIT